MTKGHTLMVGIVVCLPLSGCATALSPPPRPTVRPAAPAVRVVKPMRVESVPKAAAAKETPSAPPPNETVAPSPLTPANATADKPAAALSAQQPLAVLRVEAGALITQVNGDPKIRCTRPDCSIPLAPGTHRVTVLYRDTTVRAGSRVTYASMYPRVVELTLEPGHHYSMTASGRYSQKWWIEVEDQTADKVVYDDRKKPE